MTEPKSWSKIPDDFIVASARLSKAAIVVYLCVAKHSNFHSGLSWPTGRTMARLMGISQRQIWRGVAELKRAGWISISEGVKTKGGTTNLYQLSKPSDKSVIG